jgi:predicted ribosome quality control (RQC) complex YloA/Tae2 family protein
MLAPSLQLVSACLVLLIHLTLSFKQKNGHNRNKDYYKRGISISTFSGIHCRSTQHSEFATFNSSVSSNSYPIYLHIADFESRLRSEQKAEFKNLRERYDKQTSIFEKAIEEQEQRLKKQERAIVAINADLIQWRVAYLGFLFLFYLPEIREITEKLRALELN